MATAGSLRQGLAFVEIGIDENFLRAELEKAKQQVGKMAGEIRGATAGVGAGAVAGIDISGYDLLFARIFGSVRGLRHVIETATAATAAFRGEWDRAAETARSLPLVKEMEDFVRVLANKPSVASQNESLAGLQGLIAESEKGGLKLVDVFDRLRSETKTSGLRDLALELAKIEEETKKLTAEAWANPSTDDALRATVLGQIQLWREAKVAVAEAADAYAKLWKEISEGSDRDVVAYFETVADIAKEGVEEDKEYLDQRWRNMEDAGDRLAAEYGDQVSSIQEFYREIQELTQSTATPEERLIATEEDLRVRLGLGVGDEVYRRVLRRALEDAAAAMPDVLRTEVRQMTGGFGAQFMGVGSQGDPKLVELKKHTKLMEDIARKVGIDPGVLVTGN